MYTNMATGIIYLVSEKNKISLKDFVTGSVKKYVAGSGKAEKRDVELAVLQFLLPGQIVKTEHESGVIAFAIPPYVRYYQQIINY